MPHMHGSEPRPVSARQLWGMGLLGVVVAAHINSVRAAIGIHALQLHGLVGQAVRHVQHFFNAVDPAQYRHRRPPGRWTSWKNGSEWFPARSGPYQPGPAEGPVWYSSLKNPFWNQSGGMTAASPQAHTGARCGLAAFLGQYRIILSADTASEVRQLLSQKRR